MSGTCACHYIQSIVIHYTVKQRNIRSVVCNALRAHDRQPSNLELIASVPGGLVLAEVLLAVLGRAGVSSDRRLCLSTVEESSGLLEGEPLRLDDEDVDVGKLEAEPDAVDNL
jgi:hypothetical protein